MRLLLLESIDPFLYRISTCSKLNPIVSGTQLMKYSIESQRCSPSAEFNHPPKRSTAPRHRNALEYSTALRCNTTLKRSLLHRGEKREAEVKDNGRDEIGTHKNTKAKQMKQKPDQMKNTLDSSPADPGFLSTR